MLMPKRAGPWSYLIEISALAGLPELEHGIVVVHRVSLVRITPAVFEVLLEHSPDCRRIHR